MKIDLHHVLVPTDFSEPSEGALQYGYHLCEAFGARLTLLHVSVEPWGPPQTDAGYVPPLPDLVELEKSARKKLDESIKPGWREKVQIQTAWTHGTPFPEIVRHAREHDVDLIVMGTHGRGPIAHLLLGSVAENVVRHAPCPVLTVRETQHAFEMP